MNTSELNEVMKQHKLWVQSGSKDGNRACLIQSNLEGAKLRGINLSWANLVGANLANSILVGAKLQGALLMGSDLLGANLSGANLEGANLSKADLTRCNIINSRFYRCIGNGKEVKNVPSSLIEDIYIVTYTKDIIYIGCKGHTFEEWSNFTDDEIHCMDNDKSAKFWKKYKDIILNYIKDNTAI